MRKIPPNPPFMMTSEGTQRCTRLETSGWVRGNTQTSKNPCMPVHVGAILAHNSQCPQCKYWMALLFSRFCDPVCSDLQVKSITESRGARGLVARSVYRTLAESQPANMQHPKLCFTIHLEQPSRELELELEQPFTCFHFYLGIFFQGCRLCHGGWVFCDDVIDLEDHFGHLCR